MLTATFRSMVAHKLRLVLTTMSITLGVALLAGTMSSPTRWGSPSTCSSARSPPAPTRSSAPRRRTPPPRASAPTAARSPASVLDQIRQVDGVRAAEGSVRGYALLTDNDGRAITTNGGAPTNGYSMPADDELLGDVEILSGHAPRGPHEVVIDGTSAADHDIALGSTIKVLFQGPTQEFTVVGTVGYGDGITDLGGTTSAYFATATAQQVLGSPDEFDSIDVSADPGVSQKELADAAVRGDPAGHRGGHRRGRRGGERRGDQGELQDRRDGVRHVRRHRAVRRLVHHLEHLHDDRHPALAGDRAAACDRCPPAPGPRQPAARGARPRPGRAPRPGSGSASWWPRD